jgi:type I restriction enzyme, S subunit
MLVNWKQGTLGDIITLQRGFDLPERARQKGFVPIVSSSGVTGYHNVAKVKGPGVVTGRYGTLGEVFFIKDNFWPLNTTLFVSNFKGNDPCFISYFLRTLNLARQNNAGAVPGVNRNVLHLLPVCVPSPPIQCKIASILSAYDALIENNTHRISILEKMAHMLYQEWFVQFRFPGHEQVTMVESEMGMIPEGWEIRELGAVLTLQRGFDLPTSQRQTGNIPVYAATGINGMHNEAKTKGPGVITGRSGSIGTVMYVKEDFWPLNTTLWVKNFHLATPIYSFYLLNNINLSTLNSGAAVPTLNRNDVHKVKILLPSKMLISQFTDYALSMFDMKWYLSRCNANLRRTRDLLLPKLISGEIDVSSWAEDKVEAEEALAVAAKDLAGVRERLSTTPIDVDSLEQRSLWG